MSSPPSDDDCLHRSLALVLVFLVAADSPFASVVVSGNWCVSVCDSTDVSFPIDGEAEAFIFPLLFSPSASFAASIFLLGAATTVDGSADSCVLNIT